MIAPASHFFVAEVDEEDRRQTTCARGERGVCRDAADSNEVHGRERRTGIKAVPAEPQNKPADNRDGEIVRKHRAAAVTLEPATNTRAKA